MRLRSFQIPFLLPLSRSMQSPFLITDGVALFKVGLTSVHFDVLEVDKLSVL